MSQADDVSYRLYFMEIYIDDFKQNQRTDDAFDWRCLCSKYLHYCGSCKYPLNLTGSNRVASSIDSKYRKSINKGYISFRSIDPSRFTQVDKVKCLPISWGRNGSKSKLLCRKCGVLIGYGYCDAPALCGIDQPTSSASSYKKIMVKIRALQPSEDS